MRGETLSDIQYGLRSLRRIPGFVLATLLTLGVGIGGTTAIFSVVDRVVFRPLIYKDPQRLFAAYEVLPASATPRVPVSANHFRQWQTAVRSFDMALVFPVSFTLTGTGDPERVWGALASAALFSTLGTPVLHGRAFAPEEEVAGRDHVVVLDDEFWSRRYDRDPSVVGKSISINGEPHTVIGVLAPAFGLPNVSHLYPMAVTADRPQFWKPLVPRPFELTPTGGFNFACIVRLKPNIAVAQALADVDAVQATISRQLPGNTILKTALVPLQEQLVGSSRAGLQLLLATAAVVLLVGCINIASLFLTRGAARQRELAIRQALGADRRRLFRQLLTESLMLAAAGGVLGAALAPTAIRLIIAWAPVDVPRITEVALDARVMVFAAALSLASGLIFGVLPAWRLSALEPVEGLKSSAPGLNGSAGPRIPFLLVALEVCASTACVVIAGLLVSSMSNVLRLDRGFQKEHIVSAELRMPAARYSTASAAAFLKAIRDEVASIPGVTSVGISDRVPLSGEGGLSPIALEGTSLPRLQRPVASLQLADGGYFRTLGVPVLSGRVFEDADRQGQPVAVVATSAAARLWPGQDAIGKRFRFGADTSPLVEVVGIVGDVRSVSLESKPPLSVYLPYWTSFVGQASLNVRTAGDSLPIVPALRAAVRRQNPDLAVPVFRSMDQIISRSLTARQFQVRLVLLFSSTALILACLGIYGTLTHATSRRTQEIGVRMALGAQPGAIKRMIVANGLRPVVIGIAAGFALSLGVGRVLRSLLFGVTPSDPRTFALAAVVVATVGVLAAYLPGRRASRVNPITAIRYE